MYTLALFSYKYDSLRSSLHVYGLQLDAKSNKSIVQCAVSTRIKTKKDANVSEFEIWSPFPIAIQSSRSHLKNDSNFHVESVWPHSWQAARRIHLQPAMT